MKVTVENKTFHLLPTPTPFQLNGRRTTGTFAKYDKELSGEETSTKGYGSDDTCSTANSELDCGNPDDGDDGMPFFFKSSWTEWVRDLEFQMIRLAHERAKTLLPENFRKMVTDHIPTVIAAQVCRSVSTARFRLFLKFAGAFPHLSVDDIQKRARVRVWMVMPRLHAIHKLREQPPNFLNVFGEIIRCKSTYHLLHYKT